MSVQGSPPPAEWFVFAFDHRDSFRRIAATADPVEITRLKSVLFAGFSAALSTGWGASTRPEGLAVLVDEEYGAGFVDQARALGARVVMPIEASGHAELAFEYGDRFAEHIEAFNPDAIKVLVRWDPDGDTALNARQGRRLAELSGWMRAAGRVLMVEFLTPEIETSQIETSQIETSQIETSQIEPATRRAEVMARAVAQILDAGAEPDLWKVEGLDDPASCARVAEAIAVGGRTGARAVVLGRGTTMARAEAWLQAASTVGTFCGFAIGKTLWQEPLAAMQSGRSTTDETVAEIARRYVQLVECWRVARAGGPRLG